MWWEGTMPSKTVRIPGGCEWPLQECSRLDSHILQFCSVHTPGLWACLCPFLYWTWLLQVFQRRPGENHPLVLSIFNFCPLWGYHALPSRTQTYHLQRFYTDGSLPQNWTRNRVFCNKTSIIIINHIKVYIYAFHILLHFLNPKEILERGKVTLSWAYTHILLGHYHHKHKYKGTGGKKSTETNKKWEKERREEKNVEGK